ncbi:MAG: hypothetical protein E7439_01460 [Ruminococcaceae bacterium]|nr:hypothetical protein [Oscillospiraceae bacterium]
MKKLVALLLALAMILSMSLFLTACDDSSKKDKDEEISEEDLEKAIVGTWKGTMDLTDSMEEMLEGEGLGEYVELSKFKVKFSMEFNDDGEVEIVADEDSLNDAFETFIDEMADGMEAYLADELEKAGSDMTPDEAMKAQYGMGCKEYLTEVYESVADSMADELSETVDYELDGNKLYMFADEDTYVKISITKGGTMEFGKVSGDDEEAKFYENMTLERD